MDAAEEVGETEGEDRPCADPGHAVRGVYVEHVELLFGLINDRLAPVFEANRYFEEHTGIANKAGANNLTEALSHIGTLVEYADSMNFNEQREQVAFFGDHLRRSMMESFEQVVKARLGKIKDEGLMDRFNGEVVPLLRQGKLPTAPTEESVRALGAETANFLDKGRKLKRENKWGAWDTGSKNFADACDTSNRLVDPLRQGIGAAEQYKRDRRNAKLGWAGLIVGVLGIAVAVVLVVAA
jgi:hypothetical protein